MNHKLRDCLQTNGESGEDSRGGDAATRFRGTTHHDVMDVQMEITGTRIAVYETLFFASLFSDAVL
jgi:hypothetical protein